jgi:NTE family protein
MVAALYAAGYTPNEMKDLLLKTDFQTLLDPSLSTWWNLWRNRGIHKGERLYKWVYSLLREKGVVHFRDLKMPLRIVASDVTHREILVFDQTSHPELVVAEAVRMSIGIPFFFEAFKYGNRLVVDGGVLSNYPLWLFSKSSGRTLGLKLVSASDQDVPLPPRSFRTFMGALVSTMLEAHDKRNASMTESGNTIHIDTGKLTSTNFNLSTEEKNTLFRSGYVAATEFFDRETRNDTPPPDSKTH